MTATDVASNGCGDERVPSLRVVAQDSIDLDAAARAVFDLLGARGQDLNSEHLVQTPRRVATALAESPTPTPFTMTTFANDGGYDEMAFVRAISFYALCAHHMLPFVGIAPVAYIPEKPIVGLAKLVRVVDHFARGLQTQERLTRQVADALDSALEPRGAGVKMEATHLCMALRRVNASDTASYDAMRGLLRDDPATRSEFSRPTSASSRTYP